MPTDPVPALLDIAKATPDPRAVSSWRNAYLGTRPFDAKVAALQKLALAFERLVNGTDPKAAALVLRIVRRAQEDLAASGGRKKGRK